MRMQLWCLRDKRLWPWSLLLRGDKLGGLTLCTSRSSALVRGPGRLRLQSTRRVESLIIVTFEDNETSLGEVRVWITIKLATFHLDAQTTGLIKYRVERSILQRTYWHKWLGTLALLHQPFLVWIHCANRIFRLVNSSGGRHVFEFESVTRYNAVGNLAYDLSEQDVIDYFGQVGPVKAVRYTVDLSCYKINNSVLRLSLLRAGL
jgi:hypothetical protein